MHHIIRKLRSIAGLCAVLAVLPVRAAGSSAATPPPPPPPPPPVGWLPPQVVCAQDRQNYCGDVTPGYARVEQCLVWNMSRLAPACQAYLTQKINARRAEGREFEPEPAAE